METLDTSQNVLVPPKGNFCVQLNYNPRIITKDKKQNGTAGTEKNTENEPTDM